MLFGTATLCARVLRIESTTALGILWWASYGAPERSSSHRGPTTHMGALDWVHGSRLQSGPAMAVVDIWVNQNMDSLHLICFFRSLSIFFYPLLPLELINIIINIVKLVPVFTCDSFFLIFKKKTIYFESLKNVVQVL